MYDRLRGKNYQEDLVLTTTDDEFYGYDAVYRLTSFERGSLNGNKDDITSPDRSQTWTLEQGHVALRGRECRFFE